MAIKQESDTKQKLTPSTLQLNTNSVGQWKAEDSQNTIMFQSREMNMREWPYDFLSP